MHFLRKKLCSLTTPSLYLHFQPPLLINSITNPGSTFTNPNFSKPLYMLLFSRSSTSPNTTFEAKQGVNEPDRSKWMNQCAQKDQRASLISGLKSHYTCTTDKEDYENAVRLQLAITAATQNDAVGRVMSKLNKAIEEERHEDATFLCDSTLSTGSGLAMYLMHKVAPEDFLVAEDMKLDVGLSHLTPYPSQVLWDDTKETFKDILAGCEINRKFEGDKATNCAKLSAEEKSLIHHAYAVGGTVEKETGKLDIDFLRLPATLERKVCFLFSPSVDENNDQQVSDHYSLEDYCTLDHDILDHADCIARGMFRKRCRHESWPFVLSQAKNQQPLLSGITNFEQIEVPASSNSLNGLYIGSNTFPFTKVIQIRRRFGHSHEDGGIDNVSNLEPCEYVEVVKLTGDIDFPAGQVAFEAKFGENYKLHPWSVLEKDFGAVARYKGQGKLTGFQKSGWVNVELFILGEEYRKHGFANGYLYSAPDYHYMKCSKQMRPCVFSA